MADPRNPREEHLRRMTDFAREIEGFSCVACDALGRVNSLSARIRAMWPGARVAGPALTAQPEGDDLSAVFRAIDASNEGDVIVVGTPSLSHLAMWGENATHLARSRGAQGAVLGVPCRDVAAHSALAFPIFAAGATPQAGHFRGGGAVGTSVQIDGVTIHSGDFVVGDENGVVIVPASRLGEVLEEIPAILEKDRVTQAAIAAGTYAPGLQTTE